MPRPSPFGLEASHGELAPRAALDSPAAASEGGGKPKFASDTGFHTEIKRRVLEYFEHTGLSPRDSPRMYVKTALLLLWFGASYALLVFAATTRWQGALLSVSLALAMAGIGFGVQHDANHGAYSSRGAINRLMGMTLDMLGASSYLWRFKHNVSHHTYTNLVGADDDIDIGPLARLSPAQPRRRLHRVQHFYLWVLYGFLIPKWHFVYDFKNVARARIARNRFPRPRGWNLVELISGKVVFFGWALVVPALFHPWWVVLLFYAGISFLLGLVLSVVFQLAHCVEEADFPAPQPEGHRLRHAWAVHQVQTTVDFARGNRLLTWYVGGLNFQIEHHLFPRVCHVHYPRIAEIVQSACAEFGVRYTAHESLRGAVSSHWRWLRRMGRPLAGLAARGTGSSFGGGWRLRRRYLDAFAGARHRIHVAHGYFLPDLGVIRAITAAARRGVQVRLLLAGRSDVPFARAATRSLYLRLLAAGVSIHEWSHSVLHAKVATVDGRRRLVGSFNLDPFSLANLEALVEVADVRVVEQGEAWIQDHFEGSRSITSVEAGSWVQRWLLDPLGFLVARLAAALSRVLASRRQRRVPADHRVDVADHRSAGEVRS